MLHARASAALLQELQTDKSYRDLVSRMVTTADERVRRADVSGIEKLVAAVLKADDRLGRRRPQTTAALLATLDGRLDAARRLRLARDAWAMRREGLVDYQRRIRPALDRLRRSSAGLEQIRQLSGPSPEALTPLAARVTDGWRALKNIRPPSEAEPVHNLFVSALQLAIRAASSRHLAITGGRHEHGVGSLGGRGRRAAHVRAGTRGPAQADDAPRIVITPRTTRLLRVPDLQAMHRALAECAAADASTPLAIIVPTSGAAEALLRTFERLDPSPALPRDSVELVTRDEFYARLHARLPPAPRMLTAFEREVLLTRAASEAGSSGTPAPFRLRPGLIVEILAFYDELRRRDRTVADFERLMIDSLHASVEIDRGAERLFRQTQFLARGVHALRVARRVERRTGRARAAPVAADTRRIPRCTGESW